MSHVSRLAFASCFVFLTGCVQEGSTPDCGGGGQASLAEEGCATPVGGSCLSESDFKKNRPSEREDDGRTVTVADDWVSYQEVRPLCDFECMDEVEFRAGRSDERKTSNGTWITLDADWVDYVTERRTDCF